MWTSTENNTDVLALETSGPQDEAIHNDNPLTECNGTECTASLDENTSTPGGEGAASSASRQPTNSANELMVEIRALRAKLATLETMTAEQLHIHSEVSTSNEDKIFYRSQQRKSLDKAVRRAHFVDRFHDKIRMDELRDMYYRLPNRSLQRAFQRAINDDDEGSITTEFSSEEFEEAQETLSYIARRERRILQEKRERHKEKKERKKLCFEEAVLEECERREREAEEERKRREEQNTDADSEATKSDSESDKLSKADAPSEVVELVIHMPKLNPLNWQLFKSAPLAKDSIFVVDILIGEPKIGMEGIWQYGNGQFSMSMNKRATACQLDVPTKDPRHISKAATEISAQTARYDGQTPLPERIRINSIQLIWILSVILGSKIEPDGYSLDENKIVMLRPFRMLTYYEREIRKWPVQLEAALQKAAEAAQLTGENHEPEKENESEDENENEKPDELDEKGYSRSETALEHCRCLIEFMDEYMAKKLAYLNSPKCEKIVYSDIWHLFKPGDVVISANGKQAYLVVNLKSSRHIGRDQRRRFPMPFNEPEESDKDRTSIECVYIHFNGNQLGPVSQTFIFPKFNGEKAVTALDVYPLRFHVLKHMDAELRKSKKTEAELQEAVTVGVEKFRKSLINRGRMFVDVASVKHMYYSGLTVDTHDEVESQVMIDFKQAFTAENGDNWRPDVKALIGATDSDKTSDGNNDECEEECCTNDWVYDDSFVETKRHEDYINKLMTGLEGGQEKVLPVALYPQNLESIQANENALTDDELIIMSYCVFGFVLRDRSWAKLDLTYLSKVTDSDETFTFDDDSSNDDKTAFGRLVIPKEHKSMVLSLVSQHFRNKISQKDRDEQVDIVRGKGKGLIILLHGAPGVGKTTTAEGVAEKFKKPLFQITCSDLGSNANEVEAALQRNFALANRWDCILLLDEADVFLAERRRDDFVRNGLVSVFLRVLEYYAGILFLTTNRIGDFDEAFSSRIHMSLLYNPLDEVSTVKVFELNLNMIRARYKEAKKPLKIDVSEILSSVGEYWRTHEKARWNGRQIRNACQTALALAEFDAQPEDSKYDLTVPPDAKMKTVHLSIKNLKVVSDAYLDFIQYLRAVHGTDAETHANEAGVRAVEAVFAAIKSGKSARVTHSGSSSRLRDFKLPDHQASTTTPSAPQGRNQPYWQQYPDNGQKYQEPQPQYQSQQQYQQQQQYQPQQYQEQNYPKAQPASYTTARGPGTPSIPYRQPMGSGNGMLSPSPAHVPRMAMSGLDNHSHSMGLPFAPSPQQMTQPYAPPGVPANTQQDMPATPGFNTMDSR